MTVNNYGIFSNPLQNPLNSRGYGNNRYLRSGYIKRTGNPSTLRVPVSRPLLNQAVHSSNQLHTPHQNQIPMGMEGNLRYRDPDRFMELPDGSVIDLKLHKMVKNGSQADNESWGSGFVNQIKEECWDDSNDSVVDSSTGMTIKDYQRQKFLEQKEIELKNNMSQLQKELLHDLESGKLFPLSKLVECDD